MPLPLTFFTLPTQESEAPKIEDPAKNNQPPFAFRIHQFLSRGDSVYATIESKDERYITLHGQRFVPGDRSRLLFPLSLESEDERIIGVLHDVLEDGLLTRLENGQLRV